MEWRVLLWELEMDAPIVPHIVFHCFKSSGLFINVGQMVLFIITVVLFIITVRLV